MYETDILIIGGGVVGLAIAKELSTSGNSIVVVEKNESFGQETSSRNSEVVHGGIYYPPKSLKAVLCVKGRELLYNICKEYNIPYKKTGKLIVATGKDEVAPLNDLFQNALANGVNGVNMLDRDGIRHVEPNIFAIAALHSPETGIIDSHRLMQHLLDFAKDKSVTFAFGSEVVRINIAKGGYLASIDSGGEKTDMKARIVINSAGLDADLVAEKAGMNIQDHGYKLHYCKGQYFRVSDKKAPMIKMLIYPVPKPESAGLGIHATLDMAGSIRLGPDHKYLNNRMKDYSVDSSKGSDFYAAAKKFLPFIERDDIFPDTAGIRPKLHGEAGGFRDFVIRDEAKKGFAGFINLIGIESPGLTASLAIAEYVKAIADKG